jgi:heterodisulfide reductase subunit B
LGEGVLDNEESCMYYFGSSTITVGKIKEIDEKRYFVEDVAQATGAKTVVEPNNDEAMGYEFFCRGPVHASAPGPG